jgi:hypothetical protein
MNFNAPMHHIGTIDKPILETALAGVLDLEDKKGYNFKFGEWLRLDSYHNPEGYKIEDVAGEELVNTVLSYFPGDVMFGWSISYLPGLGSVIDHADRMFFHRIAKRIIVPITDTPDVLNWHWNRDGTKRNYFFEYGNIYRLNTAYTHGVKSFNKDIRRAIYFDIMDSRLYEKFKTHPDVVKVILANASGEKYVFQNNQ